MRCSVVILRNLFATSFFDHSFAIPISHYRTKTYADLSSIEVLPAPNPARVNACFYISYAGYMIDMLPISNSVARSMLNYSILRGIIDLHMEVE